MINENSKVVLSVKDLTANVDGNQILKGVNLEVRAGELHAIMGPMVLVKVRFLRFWRGTPVMK